MSLKSVFVSTAPGMTSKKLGHPVPESNFASDLNKGKAQPAQTYVPAALLSLNGLVQGRSVPSLRDSYAGMSLSASF